MCRSPRSGGWSTARAAPTRPPACGRARPKALAVASPWERGSNENLNRILREFFLKSTDITADPEYLAAVAGEINDRSL